MAQALTFAAGRVGVPLLAILLVGAFSWRRRDWTAPVAVASALAGSLGLTVLGKELVGRLRPPVVLALPPYETSPAWPSGHSLNATVLAVVTAYLLLLTLPRSSRRVVGVVACALFPVLVGLSRVYLAQHWLTDVMGGWAVGLAWAMVVVVAHRVWLRLRPAST
ncbi:phosphatase PAP2 family protein [Ornithinicoccus hortensis]|uniref:PAP2 superfamily protein n=1 Tax=Ornithinicoccus hortensis TaxID=82346 RepID=A0A542YVC9_9MICO|nr:phosphatase PAP2 family protein [Ornithinicoccus hortensis]TQL52030.1 PAP2 superfamily protein [Ornithinicoccus hortensis]